MVGERRILWEEEKQLRKKKREREKRSQKRVKRRYDITTKVMQKSNEDDMLINGKPKQFTLFSGDGWC